MPTSCLMDAPVGGGGGGGALAFPVEQGGAKGQAR